LSLESELIAWLSENVPKGDQVAIGIGDDAAILAPLADSATVVTTDLLTDGVDFLLDEVDPRQIGHKALAVNLSDLAAMAARPTAALISLALPRAGSAKLSALELAIELYRGMLPLAQRYEVAIAGGDTNSWEGPLAISITAMGATTQFGPLTRDGGRPGDRLLVTGCLGGSILGRHLQFEPRVELALLLNQRYQLQAGIDVSDGLALDVSRLAAASGCGAVIDLPAVPISPAAERLALEDRVSALEHALTDGEDFELVVAVAAESAEQILEDQPSDVPLTQIGELIEQAGLWQRDGAGERSPLDPGGYQHEATE